MAIRERDSEGHREGGIKRERRHGQIKKDRLTKGREGGENGGVKTKTKKSNTDRPGP